jgi:hypothetical protein
MKERRIVCEINGVASSLWLDRVICAASFGSPVQISGKVTKSTEFSQMPTEITRVDPLQPGLTHIIEIFYFLRIQTLNSRCQTANCAQRLRASSISGLRVPSRERRIRSVKWLKIPA